MAESVKRRVTAARLAVAFVAAGTIAGTTAWASASPPPTAQSSASHDQIVPSVGQIKSSDVANNSLLYKDFKKGQVPSFKMWEKLDASFFKFKKAETSFKASIKGELGDVNGDISAVQGNLDTIKGELGGYMKTSEADARYVKMNEAILGDGSVFTATQAVSKGAPAVTLATVPGQLTVEATDTQFKITNTSGGPLTHTACGVGGAGGSLADGATLSCASSAQAATVQFVNGDGHVVTLNFSNVALQNSSQATVQILVGL